MTFIALYLVFLFLVHFFFWEGGVDYCVSDPACQKIKKNPVRAATPRSVFTPLCNFDHYSIRKPFFTDKKVILLIYCVSIKWNLMENICSKRKTESDSSQTRLADLWSMQGVHVIVFSTRPHPRRVSLLLTLCTMRQSLWCMDQSNPDSTHVLDDTNTKNRYCFS